MTPQEQAEHRERERIFLQEFRAKHAIWQNVTPFGIPTNAPEPVRMLPSTNSDDGSGQKA